MSITSLFTSRTVITTHSALTVCQRMQRPQIARAVSILNLVGANFAHDYIQDSRLPSQLLENESLIHPCFTTKCLHPRPHSNLSWTFSWRWFYFLGHPGCAVRGTEESRNYRWKMEFRIHCSLVVFANQCVPLFTNLSTASTFQVCLAYMHATINLSENHEPNGELNIIVFFFWC